MKHLVFTFSILISVVCFSHAQDHIFKVLAAKGTEIKKDNKWMKVERGDKIYTKGEVKIEEGGYLGLLHKSGKSVELKKSGSYSTTALVENINTRTMDFSKKYALFAMKQMANKDDVTSMAVTGAVKRAGGTKQTKINVMAPIEFSVLKGEPFRMVWIDSLKRKNYEVTLTDPAKKFLVKEDIKGNSINLDLAAKNVSNEKQAVTCTLVVTAKDKGQVSDVSNEYKLMVLKASEEAAIAKDLVELEKELDINSAMDNLIYAMYYEEKGLILKALNHYKKAKDVGSDMPEFKDIYKEFLVRNLF